MQQELNAESIQELKHRLQEIYLSSYTKKRKSTGQMRNLKGKIKSASKQLDEASRSGQIAELHNRLRKYYTCAHRLGDVRQREELENQVIGLIKRLAEKEFHLIQNVPLLSEFIDMLQGRPYLVYGEKSLDQVYRDYEVSRLEQDIVDRVQTNPVVEFPEAREMTRHFHLHIGPTNSGKTYEAIQHLKIAGKGLYLSPLRLLALEIYDTLTDAGVRCSMLTGEERIFVDDSTVLSQTIETVDLSERYDVAVIDEAQMLTDQERGYSWSKAILGLMADEIYLCASPDALDILIEIIEKCGDVYDVTEHERKTPLRMDKHFVDLEDEKGLRQQLKTGDCFILFSKRAVLDMAARLELAGLRVSVIYGKLPPETRKREVYKFIQHETDVVVATDAIGMGINLPIRRIIFAAIEKFDGKSKRPLADSEIRQIAGRAGRFGIYEKGLVSATSKEYMDYVAYALDKPAQPIRRAILYFPKVLLDLPQDVDDILNTWAGIRAERPYEKMDVSEMTTLYTILYQQTKGFRKLPQQGDKYVIYDMISCPLDVNNRAVVSQWLYYCETYMADVQLDFPDKSLCHGRSELDNLEDYYKLLDLYHNFSFRMGKELDEERLREQKQNTELRIEQILTRNKKRFAQRCIYCGKILPLDRNSRMCDDCYHEQRRTGMIYYHKRR